MPSRTTGSPLALSTPQVPYLNYKIPASTRIDLRGISYYGGTYKPLGLRGYENSCASGGMIMGSFPLSTTWSTITITATAFRSGITQMDLPFAASTALKFGTICSRTTMAGPGHGWFWKQETDPANAVRLRLHGNVFMAETPSIHGSHVLEPSTILSCKKSDGSPDNTIVWLGAGPYPRPDELKTGCFKLSTDRAVWDSAVANWKARHGY